MTAMYTALATTTLSSASSSVTFGSIPQGYRDLVLIVTAASDTGDTDWGIQINSDTGSNYSYVAMGANSGGAITNTNTLTSLPLSYFSQISTTLGDLVSIVHIMDYAATNKQKTILSRSNRANQGVISQASRWASTSAITSLNIFPDSNNFATGSTFSLYGIAGGS